MSAPVRFALVGLSGYVVNLIVFSGLHLAGADRPQAAAGAFAVAVCNNFHWNRIWTFSARSADRAQAQALRFLVVSGAAFLLTLLVLHAASAEGAPAVLADAVAIVATTPLTFVFNRVWTFAPRISRRLQESTS